MLLPRRKKKEKKKASPGLENQKKKKKKKKKKKRQCCKKNKKEGNFTYCPGEREKKNKNKGNLKSPCACAHEHFCQKKKNHPHSIFSSFWEENILVDLRRKHLDPTIYFSSFLPNQTHSKKVFLPIFFPKFSIYNVSSPNKHTLKVFV